MKRVLVEVIIAVVFFVAGGLLLWGGNFATAWSNDQLVAQKIYFPAKGTTALNPAEFPGLQQYAGQIVNNGPKAKAYANQFIAVHVKGIAGGLTYSQLSAKAQADPTNTQLAGQVNTLFKGETLRGLLLNAWGWWSVGTIALIASAFAFLAGIALLIAAFVTRPHAHPKVVVPESPEVLAESKPATV